MIDFELAPHFLSQQLTSTLNTTEIKHDELNQVGRVGLVNQCGVKVKSRNSVSNSKLSSFIPSLSNPKIVEFKKRGKQPYIR